MAKFKGAILNCVVCDTEFKVSPNRALTAKTCSKECADKVRGKSIERQVSVTCKMCGEEFSIPRSHIDRRVFCSNACREVHPETVERKKGKIGSKNPSWKGGRTARVDGYVYALARWYPLATKEGYVLEHRLIMEQHLLQNDPTSRFLVFMDGHLILSPDYEVHHGDEDKSHNEISNLECLTPAEHQRRHAQMRREAKGKGV